MISMKEKKHKDGWMDGRWKDRRLMGKGEARVERSDSIGQL